MKKQSAPPFRITSAVIPLVSEISHALGRLSVLEDLSQKNSLCQINRVRAIQGSLSIEGNTLTEKQIASILKGKKITAPPREIQEAQNAIKVYDELEKWHPYSKKDLLDAHHVLMTGLLEKPGKYRIGGGGVMIGKDVVHLAPSSDRVSHMIDELFGWLKTTDQHPLISSSIFHYDFEFIHPFEDGNGRMGRLWQTVLLTKWNPLFACIPVERFVHEHKAEYYNALSKSTENSESSIFIEFMLKMIRDAVKSMLSS